MVGIKGFYKNLSLTQTDIAEENRETGQINKSDLGKCTSFEELSSAVSWGSKAKTARTSRGDGVSQTVTDFAQPVVLGRRPFWVRRESFRGISCLHRGGSSGWDLEQTELGLGEAGVVGRSSPVESRCSSHQVPSERPSLQ